MGEELSGGPNISASRLQARRQWMDLIAGSIAYPSPANSPESAPTGPRQPGIAAAVGAEDVTCGAEAASYDSQSAAKVVTEMVDLIVASRAYEIRASTLEPLKSNFIRALEMLQA